LLSNKKKTKGKPKRKRGKEDGKMIDRVEYHKEIQKDKS
jgi:hypothetical protein